jgi:mRNA interferase RelE/StbE
MKYSLNYSDKALKQLKKLDPHFRLRILSTLERIRIRPYPHLKKLVDTKYYRLRVGEFRVIVDVIEGELIILVIELGHRKNVYK